MRCGCVPRIFRRPSPSPRILTESVPSPSATTATEPSRSNTPLLTREVCSERLPRLSSSSSFLKEESDSDDGGPNATLSEAIQNEEEENHETSSRAAVVAFDDEATAKESSEEKPLAAMGNQHHPSSEKKSFTARRGGGLFLRSFFKAPNPIDDTTSVWVRCECLVDDVLGTVRLVLRLEEDSASALHHRTNKSGSIQSLFRIRGRKTKEESEMTDLIRARHPSSTSAKTGDETEDEEQQQPVDVARPKERSGFCFGWGLTGVNNDDDDEAITQSEFMTEAPPGLVGLMNLGNTCFLNAALQCLRCTPGFATLVVPELSQGFESVTNNDTGKPHSQNTIIPQPQHKYQGQQIRRTLKRQRSHSHSLSSSFPRSVHLDMDCSVLSRTSSLPDPLPYEIGSRLKGETGLAGGSVLRLSSAPNLLYKEEAASAASPASTTVAAVSCLDKEVSFHISREIPAIKDPAEDLKSLDGIHDGCHYKTSITQPIIDKQAAVANETAAGDRDHLEMTSGTDVALSVPLAKNDDTSPASDKKESEIIEDRGIKKGTESAAKTAEVELSVDFISAFQKLVMDVCLGEAEHHRSPRDLYLQLKKLPQGEWFCDGGQHDCQEIFKVLLDAIHASYAEQSVQTEPQFGRCISDVSTTERDVLQEIELENLKANSLWRNYLSHDASPITDVFAGQLQIVRVCQKCHCRSTTYEPFWDLSLSLSRERVSWFNPGRMSGSLDDLMRAFTAAEVLQGDEAPYCDCCEQKSPTTRRILIHRFPKVLVINIKRFKYTKDGREKLTSNITFPSRALRLHNFASKEHQHEGISEIYDLYAVSNHYGTLGGGHYTAFCKVKDSCGKDGWYSFNDKIVTKISENMVVTPNAYILFYAMRLSSESSHTSNTMHA